MLSIGCNAKDDNAWGGDLSRDIWLDGVLIGDRHNTSSTNTQNQCSVNGNGYNRE